MYKIALLVFLLIEGILAMYLGDAFWNPEKYVYTFGGDGAFIYYNMIFHTFFGDGFLLENMNYPKFESIFMTDAQASLSLVFSKLHDLFPSFLTPERIVGWSHHFHYIMIGVAGIYVVKTFELLHIKRLISVPASVLIVLLSPMIIRLTAGHFGLAYPFVFTFTFFFICQFYIKKKISIPNLIALAIILLFFGLNNFYIGMINLTFILIISLFMIFGSLTRKKGVILLGQTITTILILYFAIHFTDPGMDRIEIQWGYLTNSVDESSFLYPPTSLINSLLGRFMHIDTHGGETWINLGLSTLLILLVTIPLLLLRRLDRIDAAVLKLFIGFTISCFVMLLYASAIFYRIPFLREAFFHKISILTMFKASARFAWPIYFVASFAAIYLLQASLNLLSKYPKYLILGGVFLLWGMETHHYLDKKVFIQMHGNPYSQETKNNFLNVIESSKIDINNYQALYSVPPMEGWNDKFQIVPNFQAEYNSILFSMSTGLPMVNGMLSRIGVTDAAESLQMSSHPLIEKVKAKKLDPTKDILLVYGKDPENLSAGEQFLIDNSILLADQPGYELRALEIEDLNTSYLRDSVVSNYHLSTKDSTFHIYMHFDEENTEDAFAGKGSYTIETDKEIFIEELSDTLNGRFEVSIYVKLDNRMFGQPQFHIDLIDSNDTVIETIHFNSYKSKDIDKLWIRAAAEFDVSPKIRKLRFFVDGINQKFLVDELCIREVGSKILYENKVENEILYNNYRWEID